jgi:hypothetical protein
MRRTVEPVSQSYKFKKLALFTPRRVPPKIPSAE